MPLYETLAKILRPAAPSNRNSVSFTKAKAGDFTTPDDDLTSIAKSSGCNNTT